MERHDDLYARLFKDGTFLVAIEYYRLKVSLYALGSLFYEVYYNDDTNEIVRIELAGYEDLNKFLGQIDKLQLD